MSVLRTILNELAGLFVDDGSLAVLVLAWLAVCWLLLPRLQSAVALAPHPSFRRSRGEFSRKAQSDEQVSDDENRYQARLRSLSARGAGAGRRLRLRLRGQIPL